MTTKQRAPFAFKFGGRLLELAVSPLQGIPSGTYQFEITLFNRWNVLLVFGVNTYDFGSR